MTTHFEPFDPKQKVLSTLRRAVAHFRDRRPQGFSVGPETPARGNALLSYDPAFAVLSAGSQRPIPNSHTNYWESMAMVEILVALGYRVDVIPHTTEVRQPADKYSIVIDTRLNLERLAPLLRPECIKVMHIDSAHILFNNSAEFSRLLNLQQRRGVTLHPQRYQHVNLCIESADCATTTGNAFTIGTYAYAKKPIYRLPVSAALSYEWPSNKNWDACRRRFLWFSSGGLVHKGLDLALEAFSGMPEYQLIVCAPLDQEEEFVRAYRRELYGTPNIEAVGWVDVESPRFREITDSCVALVYPSCSEGGGASAITCMHAGLIPIVSYEASVDVDDFGFLLKSSTIEDIRAAVRMVADEPAADLEAKARKAWQSARANHTRERFSEVYRGVLNEIIARYPTRPDGVRQPTPAERPASDRVPTSDLAPAGDVSSD